ncbi:MAG: pyridoxal-phosphate-dependent aminotransferase family protein, partial [Blastocatellia bacterium]
MEACLVNLIEHGDDVVVCLNGYFSERMREMASRAGANVIAVTEEWGKPVDRNKIEEALKSCQPRVLAIVRAETSTGVLQDLTGVADLAHFHGALLVVDAVTALGTSPVSVDANDIDACFSCSQKGIGAPPGLAPVTFSEKALERIRARKRKVQSWYLDVTTIESYWSGDRTYHHTAPISMNYALREALRLLCEEGLEARFKRHELNHRAFAAGAEQMGLTLHVAPENRLPAIIVLSVPDGVNEAKVRGRLLEDHQIEISGGLGALKGKAWRIGLMGFGSTQENVLLLLEAFHKALKAEGLDLPSGVAAAQQIYSAGN